MCGDWSCEKRLSQEVPASCAGIATTPLNAASAGTHIWEARLRIRRGSATVNHVLVLWGQQGDIQYYVLHCAVRHQHRPFWQLPERLAFKVAVFLTRWCLAYFLEHDLRRIVESNAKRHRTLPSRSFHPTGTH